MYTVTYNQNFTDARVSSISIIPTIPTGIARIRPTTTDAFSLFQFRKPSQPERFSDRYRYEYDKSADKGVYLSLSLRGATTAPSVTTATMAAVPTASGEPVPPH